jgi:hypothetical protein
MITIEPKITIQMRLPQRKRAALRLMNHILGTILNLSVNNSFSMPPAFPWYPLFVAIALFVALLLVTGTNFPKVYP